ncbi:MAG: CYTH domain-containing protein [bacterium]|nr:CYTH domain-containing protein [bacterium]
MSETKQFEVEVKTLLGSAEDAERFVAKLRQHDENLAQTSQASQLNHYFDDAGDPAKLITAVRQYLTEEDAASLSELVGAAPTFSLRTRQQDGTVRLVVKAAKGAEDDQHAIARREGDYQTSAPDIDTLDEAIRQAGYGFLSKWSRDRTEYRYKDYTVCIDRNAGYGFLAEIEQLVGSEEAAATARQAILGELETLGVEELSQERLGRMFAFYNEHWPEYYRTEKTFTVT